MGDQYRPVARRAGWCRVAACLATAVWLSTAVQAGATPRLLWRLAEEARGMPARDAHTVYFLSHTHELLAASISSGRLRWRVPTDSTGSTFGSRVVVQGDVVIAGDYDLIGVDRRTGRRRWTFAPREGGGAGLYLGDAAGTMVFTGSLAGWLHAVDTATGLARWSVSVGDPAHTTVYAPVVEGASVAATFTDFSSQPAGGIVVVDMRTGTVRWKRTVPGSVGASGNPAFAGGAWIAASRDGTLHAFDASTGASSWTWPKVDQLHDEQDYRPLVSSGRTVLAGSLSGEVTAYDVLTRKVRWRRAPVMASVAFGMTASAGVLFVPYFSNQIIAFRVSDGEELWRLGNTSLPLRWVPLVDGPLLFASGSQSLFLFRHNGPHVRGRR